MINWQSTLEGNSYLFQDPVPPRLQPASTLQPVQPFRSIGADLVRSHRDLLATYRSPDGLTGTP